MEEMNNQNRNNRAWILLCASLLAASGCGSSTAETTASTAVATAAAETTQATTAETGTYTDLDLLDLDGWWVRPEGYVSIGISLLDYFYVDSDTGTWTGYDDYGQENGMGGDVWIEDGCLVLTGALGDEETAIPILDEYTLVDDNGAPYFEWTDDPGFTGDVTESGITGQWFANGDTSSDTYYVIHGDFSSEKCVMGSITNDTYHVTDMTGSAPSFNGVSIGPENYNPMQITFDNDVFSSLTLIANGKAFLSDDQYFIHEGSENDPDVRSECVLMLRTWKMTDESGYYMDFYPNYGVALYDSSASEIAPGTWSVSGGVIRIQWENGTEDELSLEIGDENSTLHYDTEGGDFTNSEW